MFKKVAFYSILSAHMIAAFLLQVKLPAHATSSLKGISIQVADSHGGEKTERAEFPPKQPTA